MILTPHILVGAAIAAKTANPYLGILFAFLSHYLLDAIPHADYPIEDLSEEKVNLKAVKEFLFAITDVTIGLVMVYILASSHPLLVWMLLTGFIAAVPDAIGVVGGYIIPRPLLKVINLGHKLHFDNKTKKAPLVIGVGSQLAVSILAITAILT